MLTEHKNSITVAKCSSLNVNHHVIRCFSNNCTLFQISNIRFEGLNFVSEILYTK